MKGIVCLKREMITGKYCYHRRTDVIPYKKITLADRGWMQEKLRESGLRGSEYCFPNQFLWGNLIGMKAAEVEGCLCTAYRAQGQTAFHDFPTGAGDIGAAINAVLEDDRQQGKQTVFRGIPENERNWMEITFPAMFSYEEKRDEWDYLYNVEELAALQGRRFHGKRNHIARFRDQGNWEYSPLDETRLEACARMYESWFKQNADRLDASAVKEKAVVKGCLSYFNELELQGGVLSREGGVVGFCIGSVLTQDTFIVHIEKAYTDIQGAYPMLNQQFVLHNMEGFRYVNREDDLGLEGLRRAKLSYHPEILLKKYMALIV